MRRSFAYLLALALTAVLPPSFAVAIRGSGPDGVVEAQAAIDLSGHWVRNDDRSDAGYWMREYPGMMLDIAQQGDTLVVRQALGRVRDGVAQPGSGDEHHEYTLIADGRAREVQGPPPVRRTVTAEWTGDELRVASIWHVGAGDDATDAPVTETWRLIDGGAMLEIRRETRMPGRPVGHDTIVFDRQR